jgi:hypothetical protein
MRKETQQLIQLLPYNMRERTRGYLDYVSDVLHEVSLQEGVYARRNEVQYEIEIIFLLKLIYAYFVTGYQNFDNILQYIEGKGAQGLANSWRIVVRELNAIVQELDTIATTQEAATRSNFSRYITTYGSVESIVRQIVIENLK